MARGIPLGDTSVEPIDVLDFDAFHARLDGTDGSLILGALPIARPGPDVPPEAAAFLGRWEGFGYGPPIRRDWRYVLAITDITPRDGTAFMWSGTNLQFPSLVERIHFRVAPRGPDTRIEWEQRVSGMNAVMIVERAAGTDALETDGLPAGSGDSGRVLLRRDSAAAVVYPDYARHLADLGIVWVPQADASLASFGAGTLVYLPVGYADDPARTWPLILFLHGSGDRGDNGLVLAQNSPFRYLTAGHGLDAIVVAPLLAADRPAFPIEYLDGILDQALTTWRVDPDRVTITGLSMGGEAAYHLARHRPAQIAGIAVLSGFETGTFPVAASWGYPAIDEPPSALAGMPVLVIHGQDDRNVPLDAATAAVEALDDAGALVELRVLDHHDHDTWSDSYADPDLFAWLLGLRSSARR